MKNVTLLILSILLFGLTDCAEQKESSETNIDKDEGDIQVFNLLKSENTNIHFINNVPENEKINILTYEYLNNGGGVAIGDVNNDGLQDIYFTGNLAANHLYINKGNLEFEEVSQQAGVGGAQGWTTGVTMADINNDGFMDIYVCQSGNFPAEYRKNLLFINSGTFENGVPQFTEQAGAYELADAGHSTQAAFFDFDRDGDLDMYLLNHNVVPVNNFVPNEIKQVRDKNVGDKIYRNDGGHFTDVSAQAGIKQNPLGYGLGVSIGDLNNDGWPDIYVANDFLEHDYLYINNTNGTFTESLKTAAKHTSQFSMGTDIADYNNDGWLDVMVLDMVAEDNYRQKTTMRGMDRTKFYYAVEDGFHYQYMMNTLQTNNGVDKNGIPRFSDLAYFANVSNTDWSWAALMADFDNDGFKDLMVTNGYKKDVSDKDYGIYEKQRLKQAEQSTEANVQNVIADLLEKIPSTKIQNYIFKNDGKMRFIKKSEAWGFDQKAFSNGAAFADLDNDGDLELVISNIDEEPFIYKNNSRELNKNHYIRFQLKGPAANPDGLGARFIIEAGDQKQMHEHYLSRGFQSSVEKYVHFGLGKYNKIDKVTIIWPDGNSQQITGIDADQLLEVNYEDSDKKTLSLQEPSYAVTFEDITKQAGIYHLHEENDYDDFAKEVLLPHKMSTFGPCITSGDINHDGLDDFYVGGAAGFGGKLYLQQKGGKFKESNNQTWYADRMAEDIGAVFFDANGNGHLDLYVVSGGNEFSPDDPLLQDRLYLNDGRGNFSRAKGALPVMLTSGSVGKAADFDNDGDLDLFVGGRLIPGTYPFAPRSYLLRNDSKQGQVKFTDITSSVAPELEKAGMVTDAVWSDFNQDGAPDLMVVGEWMPVTIMENQNGHFVNVTESAGLSESTGWWFSIAPADMDNDGDIDYIVGNLGENYKYSASVAEPFHVYCHDFDDSGSLDIVLGYYNEGTLYPLRGRQCSAEQMPSIKQKFPDYKSFGLATLSDVYGSEKLDNALHYTAKTFSSAYLENKGKGKFLIHPLPQQAQISAVNDILIQDFNGDSYKDVIIAGNLHASEVETPRNDAGVGLFLEGDGKGGFKPVFHSRNGLLADGDVKNMQVIQFNKQEAILLAKNSDYLQLYLLKKNK